MSEEDELEIKDLTERLDLMIEKAERRAKEIERLKDKKRYIK